MKVNSTQISRFKGLNTAMEPARMAPGWLTTAEHVDITNTGAVVRRSGYALQAEGFSAAEVKQFARGGAAISLAGTAGRALVDSVLQDLGGEGLTPLTLTPGTTWVELLPSQGSMGVS